MVEIVKLIPDPHKPVDPTLPAPYAGFYANLIGVSRDTKILFLVEFLLLLLMGIVMYAFFVRERHIKSKIKFTKTGFDKNNSPLSASVTQRNDNRLSSGNELHSADPLIK